MGNYKEILRLHERGSSQREISEITRSSLSTVNKTLKAARQCQVSYEILKDLSNVEIRQLLFDSAQRTSIYLQPDFAVVDKELGKNGVNLALVWDEYMRACVAAGQRGYQYSQYCKLFSQWRKEHGRGQNATMRLRHTPARLLEVDWAGERPQYIDYTTEEIVKPWAFVGCLPYSQLLYVEAFDDMRQESWSKAHVNTFVYIGGVTELITPDNCKTGVQKPDYYDPKINKDYARMAAHYGVAILPARPLRPKDKASVENSVKFVETWVIAYLRHERFFSLSELNAAIHKRVDDLNAQPFKGLDYSRNDLFFNEEKKLLRPLPANLYEYSQWASAKVGPDYCIQVDHMRYSVPYRLIGQQLEVRITVSTVEIFKDHERIASHARLYGRFYQSSVLAEHMPEKHKLYLEEWNPERFRTWAAEIGPACVKVISFVLSSKPHPAQTYRSCLGILGFAKSKGKRVLEDACMTACAASKKPSYRQIKMLVSADPSAAHCKGMAKKDDASNIGSAGFTRGAGYYRDGDKK